jgi:4-carboxy-3-alkylbut-2-enoyl-[acp] decarboxylase
VSEIISLSVSSDGMALLRMQDEAGKNTFSPPFVERLKEIFREIEKDPRIKVVIVTGYNAYFCTGGSKQELLAIISGDMTFDELGFFRLLLDCPVPTIAAMQGHAIGGGLAFGCFADLIVMSKESQYAANFMNYGFTPGMGATCVLPFKFGTLLGAEMLLTGRSYQGEELERRGVGALVVPRSEVLNQAHQLAHELILKPRTALVLLKRELSRKLIAELARSVEQELSMHAVTMADPTVRQRVEAQYDG